MGATSCGSRDIWIFSFRDEFTHYKPQLVQIWSQILDLLSHSEGMKMGYFKRLILSGYQQKTNVGSHETVYMTSKLQDTAK